MSNDPPTTILEESTSSLMKRAMRGEPLLSFEKAYPNHDFMNKDDLLIQNALHPPNGWGYQYTSEGRNVDGKWHLSYPKLDKINNPQLKERNSKVKHADEIYHDARRNFGEQWVDSKVNPDSEYATLQDLSSANAPKFAIGAKNNIDDAVSKDAKDNKKAQKKIDAGRKSDAVMNRIGADRPRSESIYEVESEAAKKYNEKHSEDGLGRFPEKYLEDLTEDAVYALSPKKRALLALLAMSRQGKVTKSSSVGDDVIDPDIVFDPSWTDEDVEGMYQQYLKEEAAKRGITPEELEKQLESLISIKESHSMTRREELETKGVSQLMAERFAKGVPTGAFCKAIPLRSRNYSTTKEIAQEIAGDEALEAELDRLQYRNDGMWADSEDEAAFNSAPDPQDVYDKTFQQIITNPKTAISVNKRKNTLAEIDERADRREERQLGKRRAPDSILNRIGADKIKW